MGTYATVSEKILHRIVAVLLAVCLTITGIYDFVVIIRNNGPGHRVSVNMNSDLTDWLEEHLTHEDLILTPEYSINEGNDVGSHDVYGMAILCVVGGI